MRYTLHCKCGNTFSKHIVELLFISDDVEDIFYSYTLCPECGTVIIVNQNSLTLHKQLNNIEYGDEL